MTSLTDGQSQRGKLGLYTHILPAGHREMHRGELPVGLVEQMSGLLHSTVYDVRQLSREFVLNAGKAQQPIVRLPHPHCYFEFEGERAICAVEFDNYIGGNGERYSTAHPLRPNDPSDAYLGKTILVHAYQLWQAGPAQSKGLGLPQAFWDQGLFSQVCGMFLDRPEAKYSIEIPKHLEMPDEVRHLVKDLFTEAGHLLLGIVSLLRDQQVVAELKRAPNQEYARAGVTNMKVEWEADDIRPGIRALTYDDKGKLPTNGDVLILTLVT
jgi:hypothetical protein